MAVVVTKDIKRKRLFLAVFVVLVLTSAIIIYLGIFKESSQPNIVLPPENLVNSNQVSDLKIKILEDDRFRNLLPPPGVPLKTETTGKSNPFSD
ncbi:MAG: hypothetical protein HYT38_00015 [Candidatus Sungbacteria bacterium]|uniref:Uncharacterized protein n=1 Tax=Candidatus Sungiibacteriota bacterium TaxID=2750080 RepID=A0A9D6DRC0_9BACT|nr:hypothetical protein [Candidatus Sungbacteria bacterium]